MAYISFFAVLVAVSCLLAVFLRVSRLNSDLERLSSRMNSLQESLKIIEQDMQSRFEGMKADLSGTGQATPPPEERCREISAAEAAIRMRNESRPLLLDIRPPLQAERTPLDGALRIPVEELARRLEEVPRDRPAVLVFCERGEASQAACELLAREGFKEVLMVAESEPG